MEHELRQNLIKCAEAFSVGRQVSLATLGRLAAGDWRFFDRLKAGERTFTARKYDEVVGWLHANWPIGSEWPSEVQIPEPSSSGAEAA